MQLIDKSDYFKSKINKSFFDQSLSGSLIIKNIEPRSDGFIAITTKFLDNHNDYIQVFVKELKNNQLLITDCCSVHEDQYVLKEPYEKTYMPVLFYQILRDKHIKVKNKELYIKTTKDKFSNDFCVFLQAIIELIWLFDGMSKNLFCKM